MRTAIAGTAIATAALAAVSVVGSAAAETPANSSASASAPSRTVSVQGVANVPVAQGASAAAATTAYRKAMAAAETDGHEKAEFLAGQVGAGLGTVQSIVEAGGWISCSGGEEGEYAEYQGEQPDFGESNGSPVPVERALAPTATAKPVAHHHRKHKRHHKKVTVMHAAAASNYGAASCTLSARVALVYALN
jgi:hypothetical protein